jgi:hypothetical protein
MRNAPWFALLLGIPAFSQTPSDNAATESLSKRLQSLKLLDTTPRPVKVLAAVTAPARVCSIPLLNAMPTRFNSKMPVMALPVTPNEASAELKLQVPAPPCDQRLFQNK